MSNSLTRPDLYISIVVPAHNEAAGIGSTIDEIKRVMEGVQKEYELIIIDDGSQDETFSRIAALAETDGRLKGVRFSRNFGKEAALLAGLEAASGDIVITMDADLQHPPGLIPELLEQWEKGFNVVHAVKQDRTQDGILTRWRAAAFNGLMTRIGGVDVRNSSDYKLLDRGAVDVIVKSLPERRRFYRGLADWIGFEQTTVPFVVAERNAGKGKWSLLSLADLATTAIVSFTSAPLRIVTFLGLLTLVFGILVAGETLWSLIHGRSVSGFATIIITLLIIGSFIMISLGIIGEYIAKMYDEIKGRPAYLVSTRCGFDDESGQDGRFIRGDRYA